MDDVEGKVYPLVRKKVFFLEDDLRFAVGLDVVLLQKQVEVESFGLGFHKGKFIQTFPDVVVGSFLYNGLIIF